MKNIYLIYTMGKVGSKTVEQSVRAHMPGAELYHVHFLTEKSCVMADSWNGGDGATRKARMIRESIARQKDARIKIITLVRDPIARDVSDFFHNMQTYKKQWAFNDSSLQVCLEQFTHFDDAYGLSWFASEFNEYLNIDIYSIPFSPTEGYAQYSLPQADILVIRVEDLVRVWSDACHSFFGRDIPLANHNCADTKDYAEQYRAFVQSVTLSAERLSRAYESVYARFFYTEEERQKFKRKWARSEVQNA
jgi:hypothetical protein